MNKYGWIFLGWGILCLGFMIATGITYTTMDTSLIFRFGIITLTLMILYMPIAIICFDKMNEKPCHKE